jgi:dynein heavy chain
MRLFNEVTITIIIAITNTITITIAMTMTMTITIIITITIANTQVRYWDKFKGDFPIPYVAHEMFLQQEDLRVVRENVMLVVRDYNTIIDALSTEERRLFMEHLRRVDRKIHPGLSNMSWSEKHIEDWFVKGCRTNCHSLYDIVLRFKANNERITKNCEKIANCLLVDIEKNVVYDSTVFENNQRQHEEKV